jgi:two-component system, cell cycle sensor histidine kinase and response regulator CckA
MELTIKSPTAAESADGSAQAAGGNPRPRVLAIDDNDGFRTMIAEMLEPMGFEVKTAANPVKGLELFTREKDSYKLVILDYYMPQLDGAKTFEWLRKLNPDVKVIICSGAEELRLRQIQAQHKIDGYLHKPFRVQEALQLISRLTRVPVPAQN